MKRELEALVGQQVPIRTRSGSRFMDYIHDVKDDVVILTTNPDGTGRQTILAIGGIESVTVDVRGRSTENRYRS